MNIIINASKLDLTPSMTKYIEDRMGSLEKFIKKIEDAETKVVVEVARASRHHKSGEVFYAEANLHLKGCIIRAEETDADVRAAVDRVKDILRLEISKFKEKPKAKRRCSSRKAKALEE